MAGRLIQFPGKIGAKKDRKKPRSLDAQEEATIEQALEDLVKLTQQPKADIMRRALVIGLTKLFGETLIELIAERVGLPVEAADRLVSLLE
jgi:hypothetical protein